MKFVGIRRVFSTQNEEQYKLAISKLNNDIILDNTFVHILINIWCGKEIKFYVK